MGYTELRLDIPEINEFDHDMLMMIYPDSKYSHKVPIIIGTLHIDQMLELATAEEFSNLGSAWTWGAMGRKVIAKQLQLSRGELEPMIYRINGEVQLTKM